jgi:hypothetical protein
MKDLNLNPALKKLRKLQGRMKENGITNRSIARKVERSEALVSMVLSGKAKAQHILDTINTILSGYRGGA